MKKFNYEKVLDRRGFFLRKLLKEIEGHLGRLSSPDLESQRTVVLKQILEIQILRFNRGS